ncbi:MAG: hypothetical protein JNJ73_07255 [Hyphomonadaceae bacterium]|nr:hypothetical protein [Hyphomonadaceae bacterium]
MRALHIAAALSGALALVALATARHGAGGGNFGAVYIAGFTQLASAAAGLAIAVRAGRLNLLAGALILGGAALFAGVIYIAAFLAPLPLGFLAPVGGAAMIAGWLLLAFAPPKA